MTSPVHDHAITLLLDDLTATHYRHPETGHRSPISSSAPPTRMSESIRSPVPHTLVSSPRLPFHSGSTVAMVGVTEKITGERDIFGFFEKDGNALAELQNEARCDGLREVNFEEVDACATFSAGSENLCF
jgi:hypothetical protein